MTDGMIEAVAWRKALLINGWTKVAIEELEITLAKAGLGIRPRKATQEMLSAISGNIPPRNHADAWEAMWCGHQNKPDG